VENYRPSVEMGRVAIFLHGYCGHLVVTRHVLASKGVDVNIRSAFLAATGILGILAVPALGQAPPSASPPKTVSRTTKAVNYRRAGGSTRIDFQGTELMQQAVGEAKVQKQGQPPRKLKQDSQALMRPPSLASNISPMFSGPSLPEAGAVNLGELVLKKCKWLK